MAKHVNKNTSSAIGMGASMEEAKIGATSIDARRNERISNQK